MEFVNNPRNPTPPRPVGHGPSQPQRRVFNDFGPRPQVRSTAPATSIPVRTAAHPQVPAAAPSTMPTPTAARVPAPAPRPATPVAHPETAYISALKPLERPAPSPGQHAHHGDTNAKQHKPQHNTHAGLVGLICFVVFGGILLSPLLPSKVLDNFPGNSQSVSSGEQSLGCLDDLANTTTATHYNIKLGSPIVYTYSTTTTDTATCDGKRLAADTGHTSQFNPLGLLADTVLVLAISVSLAKLWHKLRAPKD